MSATPLLIKPTLPEVKLLADKIGLPAAEAEAFFYYYESNGWKVGKVPMKCWKSALQGWRIRWQQRQQSREQGAGKQWIMQKEYERLIDRMKVIRNQYSEHQNWTARDVAEYKRLKDRKAELMKALGIMI